MSKYIDRSSVDKKRQSLISHNLSNACKSLQDAIKNLETALLFLGDEHAEEVLQLIRSITFTEARLQQTFDTYISSQDVQEVQ